MSTRNNHSLSNRAAGLQRSSSSLLSDLQAQEMKSKLCRQRLQRLRDEVDKEDRERERRRHQRHHDRERRKATRSQRYPSSSSISRSYSPSYTPTSSYSSLGTYITSHTHTHTPSTSSSSHYQRTLPYDSPTPTSSASRSSPDLSSSARLERGLRTERTSDRKSDRASDRVGERAVERISERTSGRGSDRTFSHRNRDYSSYSSTSSADSDNTLSSSRSRMQVSFADNRRPTARYSDSSSSSYSSTSTSTSTSRRTTTTTTRDSSSTPHTSTLSPDETMPSPRTIPPPRPPVRALNVDPENGSEDFDLESVLTRPWHLRAGYDDALSTTPTVLASVDDDDDDTAELDPPSPASDSDSPTQPPLSSLTIYCPILCRDTEKWVRTSCGHDFDEDALKQWLFQRDSPYSCPICREPFRKFGKLAQREVARSLVLMYVEHVQTQYRRLWFSSSASIIERFFMDMDEASLKRLSESYSGEDILGSTLNVAEKLRLLMEEPVRIYCDRLKVTLHEIVIKDIKSNLPLHVPPHYRSQINKDNKLYLAYSCTRLVPEFFIRVWKENFLDDIYSGVEELFVTKLLS